MTFFKKHWGLWLAAVLLFVLFFSSSMTYKEQTTVPLLERLLHHEPFKQALSGIHFNYAGEQQSIAEVGYFKFVEFFIRKGAHVSIFFLLGLGLTQGTFMYQKNRWLHWPLMVLSCTGVAAFDEFHQMLTGGRTPLFQDVMLDTAAAAVAVTLMWLWLWRQKRH
ncbi:VanZ family protein [Lacticaseibacillus paracasei]|uniref:Predicted integral membrane protein n=1 Tax=Lacticaseibacillus paracasei (strain ATCC 334 / BCRC 17002 / CCUG 31169 / CIP 107868 / KCTC 3260 / NRRL B-441) TaxID=321967 RepID=Q03AF6_LACP3|nr:VanZ family protein [Lacticaseibacillus paracasei]ABJ69816.1 Predicted integral membrane protein [Lacticaseibacillus paracasei ATCC 334]KRK16990.1 integral membrane protein [Lacticaseibacillus casei DSM 20011 = JCM 1134 = ATCC 393]OPH05568.1 hypothetical protein B4586_05230 [Lacticaseibacillus paracasei]OSY80262.1 hypothetical protein BLW95_08185 [Lacticaseibacillus paracasei]